MSQRTSPGVFSSKSTTQPERISSKQVSEVSKQVDWWSDLFVDGCVVVKDGRKRLSAHSQRRVDSKTVHDVIL